MGAPALAPRRAPARRAPARRAPAPRRSAPRRRKPRPNSALTSRSPRAGAAARHQGVAQPALAGALIPHAAARTAGAVRDLSDSSLIVRLTAGRGWIAVLCALLGEIVALNVVSLSINATSGRVSQAIDEYERQNSSLRGELAERLSASRVGEAAANLGLAVPAPEDVTYVNARDSDLERLANALGGDTPLSTDTVSDSPSSGTASSGASFSEPSYTESAPATPSAPSTPPALAPATPPASSGGGGGATGGVGL